MTEHVRSYLLQQFFDVIMLLIFVNTVTIGNTDFSGWYFQWGRNVVFYAMIGSAGAMGVLSLWRPRADPADFDWSQVRHWLYLYNEQNGDYQRYNLTWSKLMVFAAVILAIFSSQFQQFLGLTQVAHIRVGLSGLVTGIFLMNMGLWGYRWWQHRMQLSGRD